MSDYSKIVILCEDRQQEVFTRCFLISRGVNPHRIYPRTCKKGKQAGEQFVRQEYPREVLGYRRNSGRLSAGLVVMTDADVREVANRLNQLDAALIERNIPSRKTTERIGIFIPKRNIETWINYLMGQTVTENDLYPHLKRESECIPFVEALARSDAPLPQDAPPSLKTACDELSRIFPEE
jgi:hypothetical protein